jgi:calcineurin-like phosphoesterase family protein
MLNIFYKENNMDRRKYFVVSDHHFNHKNIMVYENRPFDDLEHMEKELIKRHNSVVKKDDIVFFLGDISFTNKENTKRIIESMNGYKILIMGNHDRKNRNWHLECGFSEVIKYPIIFKGYFILSHEPVYLNGKMPYVNIHGHIHGKNMAEDYYVNVSVEQIDYTPVNIDEIIERFNVD